jgi:hypothetical protein
VEGGSHFRFKTGKGYGVEDREKRRTLSIGSFSREGAG